MRIGVDTGGTFTDLLLYVDENVPLLTHKLPSTPENPAKGVLEGIDGLLQKYKQWLAHTPPEISFQVIHGSTVATNALLEGKGGQVAIVGTAGFEDLLWLSRQAREHRYRLHVKEASLPITREHSFGVEERILFDGTVQRVLEEKSIQRLVQKMSVFSFDAIVICLLHSYVNPVHEKMLEEALREAFPARHITRSSSILPTFREYERLATCLVNGVVATPMNRYIDELAHTLEGVDLQIMVSSGGHLPPPMIQKAPIQTILSGPAGGVVGALQMAKQAEVSHLLTLDMGGTSTDVALCLGVPPLTQEGAINRLPVSLPMLDIETVGAGGGSIAWLDTGGALKVGPQSTGASPGPACYGKQTPPWVPTVTDAHLVLGHLSPKKPLAGYLHLNLEFAKKAIHSLATQVGISTEELALGVIRIAESTMARAIHRISVHRGHDPREFTLMPFGGAGGLHACRLAQQLGIKKVLIPSWPGLLSAFGMLASAPLYHFTKSILISIDALADSIEQNPQVLSALDTLKREAEQTIATQTWKYATLKFGLDLRYQGQSYEIYVPWSAQHIYQDFQTAHQQLYGYVVDAPVEIVNARLSVSGRTPSMPIFSVGMNEKNNAPQKSQNKVFDGKEWCSYIRVHRSSFEFGESLKGPMIVDEYSATHLIPAGWSGVVDTTGQLSLVYQEV